MVFSQWDGIIANLPAVRELAQRYDAVVMVDDLHAVGFMGATGAGTPQDHGVQAGVQLLSGTFGKALGGASGGYIAGPRSIVALLRQRARPYLFSNALAPAICAATLVALELVTNGDELRTRLQTNARYFRDALSRAGFKLTPGEHPIIPIMLGDARKANELAADLFTRGVYVTAFSYPVVPEGMARIRTQMSAAHTLEQLEQTVEAFVAAGHATAVLRA